jgi:hypothetical protein
MRLPLGEKHDKNAVKAMGEEVMRQFEISA